MYETDITVHLRKLRQDTESLSIIDHRIIQPALLPESVSKIAIGLGKTRLEFQGSPVRGDCIIQFSLLPEGVTKVVMRLYIVRLESQSLPDEFDTDIDPACIPRQESQEMQCIGMIRFKLKYMLINCFRLRQTPPLVMLDRDLKVLRNELPRGRMGQ
jgi:hypothetical protein